MYAVAWREGGETHLFFYSTYLTAYREFEVVREFDSSAKLILVPEAL